jgi:thymidylate kinase
MQLLITLSGIDGSGKSSICKQIQTYLCDQHGWESSYVWCKFGDHPLSPYHFPRNRIQRNRIYNPRKFSYESGTSPISRLYARLLLLCHMFRINTAVRVKLYRGEIVICDRYIFDTLVDLQQDFGYSKEDSQKFLNLERIPKPNIKYLLDLPERIAFARKTDIYSVTYLNERRRRYLDLVEDYDLRTINAAQPVELVTNLIINSINDYIIKGYHS